MLNCKLYYLYKVYNLYTVYPPPGKMSTGIFEWVYNSLFPYSCHTTRFSTNVNIFIYKAINMGNRPQVENFRIPSRIGVNMDKK